MSDEMTIPEGIDAAEMLRAAARLFEMSYQDLSDLVTQVNQGDLDHVKDLRSEIMNLKKATFQLHEEAQNVRKLCGDDAFGGGAAGFNLDQARSEIGSGLALSFRVLGDAEPTAPRGRLENLGHSR